MTITLIKAWSLGLRVSRVRVAPIIHRRAILCTLAWVGADVVALIIITTTLITVVGTIGRHRLIVAIVLAACGRSRWLCVGLVGALRIGRVDMIVGRSTTNETWIRSVFGSFPLVSMITNTILNL